MTQPTSPEVPLHPPIPAEVPDPARPIEKPPVRRDPEILPPPAPIDEPPAPAGEPPPGPAISRL